MNNNLLYKIIFLLTIFELLFVISYSQEFNKEKTFNSELDTLPVIGSTIFCKYRNTISRDLLLYQDSILINLKEFRIVSFKMSAFALGHEVELVSYSNLITSSMKKTVNNTKVNYKFVYFEDIKIVGDDNIIKKPSIDKIKLIFID